MNCQHRVDQPDVLQNWCLYGFLALSSSHSAMMILAGEVTIVNHRNIDNVICEKRVNEH